MLAERHPEGYEYAIIKLEKKDKSSSQEVGQAFKAGEKEAFI